MVSLDFINECKNDVYKNRFGKLSVEGVEFTGENNLQNFTIDSGCYVDGMIIGTMCSKKMTSELLDTLDNNFVDKNVYVSVGVKYASDLTEYINLGKYIIERPKDEITADFTSITAYDELVNNLDKVYICGLDYENNDITVANLYIDLCNNLGLTPKATIFTCSTIPIQKNPFTNGETNREVLKSIETVSCTFAQINSDTNEIDLCWLSENENPDYTFELSDYSTLNGGKITYGPINSLVVKYSEIDDENITIVDNESIAINGENQLVISDDYILVDSSLRELAITEIWNKVKNLKYVDCELTTSYGKPFLKIGDKIRVYTDDENYFDTYVLQHIFTFDGTFKSVIKSPVLTKQEVSTKQEQTLGKRLRATEIKINKQEGRIDAVASDVEEQKTEVAQLAITSNSITQEVSSQKNEINNINNSTKKVEETLNQVKLDLNGLNVSLQNTQKNIENMDFNFKKDGLSISTNLSETNSRLDNEGIKVYNYTKLSAIFNNKGSGLEKLIVTETAQIGYLRIVKGKKGNKKVTQLFHLENLIEDLSTLAGEE